MKLRHNYFRVSRILKNELLPLIVRSKVIECHISGIFSFSVFLLQTTHFFPKSFEPACNSGIFKLSFLTLLYNKEHSIEVYVRHRPPRQTRTDTQKSTMVKRGKGRPVAVSTKTLYDTLMKYEIFDMNLQLLKPETDQVWSSILERGIQNYFKTPYTNVTSERKGLLQQLKDYFFQRTKREDN